MKRSKKKRGRIVTAKRVGGVGCLVIVIALVAGGFFLYRYVQDNLIPDNSGNYRPGMDTEDIVVERGDVTEALSLYGQVQPVRAETLSFRAASGRIVAVNIEIGMPVFAGQVLVSLDAAALDREVKTLKAELIEAQEALDDMDQADPLREYELSVLLKQARESLAETQAALDELTAGGSAQETDRDDLVYELKRARRALDDLITDEDYPKQIEHLEWQYNIAEVEHGPYVLIENPSEKDRDVEWLLRIDMLDRLEQLESAKLQRRAALASAEQAVVSAQRALDLYDLKQDSGVDEVERARLRAQVAEAQANVTRLEEAASNLGETAETAEYAQAKAKVLKLEGQVRDAEAALADADLVAPFDGVVTDLQAVTETMASQGAQMVTIADTSQFQIVAQLGELDVVRVSEGQDVTVSFDAFEDTRVSGRLGEIPRYGTYQNGQTVFQIVVEVDVLDVPVREGMSANIGVPLAEKEDVLVIPAAAISDWGMGTFVTVVVDDNPEQRQIRTGVGDGITVEVVEGLNEGDVVRVPLVGPRGSMPIQY